jgi:hypothetical protein
MQAYSFPNVFNESIYFEYAPVPTFAGHINRYPFKIVITSSNDKEHTILLDSLYSKSYKPQKSKSKWSFLRPEVRFLDLSGKEISQIKTKDTKLYKDSKGVLNTVSGVYMGVSGYAEFYFVDDIYNYDLAINGEKYTTIVAILETPDIQYFDTTSEHLLDSNFSNSRAIAYQPHVFHYRDPDFIKITENGIRDFINPRWQPSNQYVVFAFDWNKTYQTLYYDGNEITPLYFNKSIPSNTNTEDVYINPASNSVRLYFFDEIKLSYKDEYRYLTPGYSKTFFNLTTSNPDLLLSATSTFLSPDPFGSYYSPKLWLSNPNAGLMTIAEFNFPNIFKFSQENLLKAQIHNFGVPVVYRPNFRKERVVKEILNPDTEINIWLDSSGSMGLTLNRLTTMRDTILRETLLPIYKSEELYNQKVKVLLMSSSLIDNINLNESCILCAAKGKSSPTTKNVINLIFQDEADLIYHGDTGFDPNVLTNAYRDHITRLRNVMLNDTNILSVIFQIKNEIYPNFFDFLNAVENCLGSYTDNFGGCDLPNLRFEYNVQRDRESQYYLDKILDILEQENVAYRKEYDELNDPFAFSGFHSINSIAVLPPPSFQAWAVDSELNYLYKINTNGSILSAIDLLKIYKDNSRFLPPPRVNEQVTPCSIVLDKDLNMWISFYDTKQVLNLDKDGKFVFLLDLNTYVPEIIPPNIDLDWYKANQPSPDIDTQSQNFIEPTFVDVDSKNDIWVTYSNYASGYLSKFDKNNNLYVNISYPSLDSPQDLIVDNQDNVWVALANNSWRSFGKIEKRNTNGVLLSSFDQLMGVNELALDPDQNLWFTYSYSRVGFINNKTGQVLSFDTLKDTDKSRYAPPNVTLPNVNTDETALEGIACDAKGYLYVVNSVENRVYVYNTKNGEFVEKFYVNPQGFVFWNPSFEGETQVEYNEWNKSLQAHGDWIGTKWSNKFYHKFVKPKEKYTKTIEGKSVPLQFIKIPSSLTEVQASFLASSFYKYIETDKYEKIKVSPKQETVEIDERFNLDFYKINENFDLAAQLKALALTPTLENSEFLFEKFLPSIYGNFPYSHTDLGIYSYEKIANFVLNNSDVDVCEIKSLYSLAQSINEKIDDYSLNYPLDMKSAMDILSINMSRLYGSVNKNQNDFSVTGNLGRQLLPEYKIKAGESVILKTTSLNKYEIISTGIIDGKTEYTIDELAKFIKLDIFDDNLKKNKGIPKDRTFKLTSEFQDNSDEKIKKSIDSFVKIIKDKNETPKTTPNGMIDNGSYETASQNILNYKSQLQDQIIQYANYFYPTALSGNSVLTGKCYRDLGYIVDAIAADIANNANHRSIDVSDIYYKGPVLLNPTTYQSTIPTIPTDQVEGTIAAINALRYYITGENIPTEIPSFTNTGILSSVETGSFRKNDVKNRIDDIVFTLRNNGQLKEYFPKGNPDPVDISVANNLLNKKEQIKAYMYDFVGSKRYINLSDPVLNQIYRDKCNRDIGLMVDSIVNDLKTGVVSKSIQYALAYWDGNTSRLPETDIRNQVDKTIDTVLELQNYLIQVSLETLEKIYANSNPSPEQINEKTLLKNNLWSDYYEFFLLNPTEKQEYKDNIIDWNNPQTTIQNEIKNADQWIGDEQFLDSLLSYKLYRGLNIF